ncbi:nicotinamide mononucleotide transporter [Paenibacillus rhizovicinus]|uniref:Nicotinamide mononucleotide transporter n=1 Tax=Paenibacillus rhizovicinus TaxID=2704463 RepID=A0A6C0P7L9_9BACL|nr:nicotinamide riboside transporter PnuC [Paenibacillus rhizovicinus]QHW34449.1 nicotinamide mononucleotide transporter [Paenibacillus rhizovicinus]
MNRPWVLPVLFICMIGIAGVTSSTTLEIVATTTGLLSVWLTARERISAWPVGLVNVACFFYMFEDAKLYADMMLQVFFFALTVYGWMVWLTNRGTAKVRPTRRLTLRQGWLLAVLLPVITLIWGYLLQSYTDASIPYADALIATLSLIAQYLLSSKVFENWMCWIAVDVLSVAMYAYKDLYTLAFLYVIFLAIAIAGHISWRRALQSDTRGLPA